MVGPGKRTQARVLDVWINGLRVGQWQVTAQGEDRFIVGPEIGDGGEARHQGAARIAGADHGLGGL